MVEGNSARLAWSLKKRVTAYEVAEFTRANEGSTVFRLPPANELDNIQRYEARLTRQFYQAKHELEVLQKQRRGEATSLVRLDVQGAPEQSERAAGPAMYEVKPIRPFNPARAAGGRGRNSPKLQNESRDPGEAD